MDYPYVLLHGSANASYSWSPVRRGLMAAGKTVFTPDMLGYGAAPSVSASYDMAEEVAFLQRWLDQEKVPDFHLVSHSLGSMYALHLRRAVGSRVRRLTLIDPFMVSVLREARDEAAFAEMDQAMQTFQRLLPDAAAAAQSFVEHWGGPLAWTSIGDRARSVITSLVPKVLLEMKLAREDTSTTPWFAEAAPPTTILVGERTRLAPRAVAKHLAEAFHATCLTVPGAGHMIPLTHPSWLVQALLRENP